MSRVVRAFAAGTMLLALALGASGCGEAQAAGPTRETFTLGERDKVIVEASGCHSECRKDTPTTRTCTVKNYGCRVTCTILPECKPDGLTPMRVCAITREGP